MEVVNATVALDDVPVLATTFPGSYKVYGEHGLTHEGWMAFSQTWRAVPPTSC
ncbi:MAG: hypothetical protein ABWK01_07705 [Infirmifilum sp.]